MLLRQLVLGDVYADDGTALHAEFPEDSLCDLTIEVADVAGGLLVPVEAAHVSHRRTRPALAPRK